MATHRKTLAAKCYVCGKPVHNRFVLFSMVKDTDRPFVVHEGPCSDRVEDSSTFSIDVTRVDRS